MHSGAPIRTQAIMLVPCHPNRGRHEAKNGRNPIFSRSGHRRAQHNAQLSPLPENRRFEPFLAVNIIGCAVRKWGAGRGEPRLSAPPPPPSGRGAAGAWDA